MFRGNRAIHVLSSSLDVCCLVVGVSRREGVVRVVRHVETLLLQMLSHVHAMLYDQCSLSTASAARVSSACP